MENNSQPNVAAVSDRGLSEKRPTNEDSYLVLREKGVFAVADGVGGAQAGDVASQMAMEILGEAFTHYGDSAPPEEILRVAIERANQAVYQMASELPQLASMATTIAAMHLKGDVATIAHVGDSRVYRVDSHGNIERETLDHSVVEEEVRAGRMTAEQAANHPSRNVISRAVGAESTVEVDIKTIMAAPGSSFILCSDGVTRHIEDSEIAHILTSGMAPETICETLKDLCYERGAEDNLTAVVVQMPAAAGQSVAPAPIELPEEAAAAAPIFAQEAEEETVATARSPFDQPAAEEPRPLPANEGATTAPPADEDDHFLLDPEVFSEPTAPSKPELVETYTSEAVTVPAAAPPPEPVAQPVSEREFSMFGEGAGEAPKGRAAASGSGLGTFLSAFV
ncbi:MAG TPA: PP2C family serine/threonine-protein phosphatase, partial [Pyrinomonadaceae bacterium]|nr:PP2C family serine/threonine-protein phosphatase [Pyrinomonadaceae bacterium]